MESGQGYLRAEGASFRQPHETQTGTPQRTDLLLAARSLLLEREAGIAAGQLRGADVPSILLKGPAIASWLYDDGEARPYLDVDLLVSPAQFRRAIEVLGEIGYVPRIPGASPAELGPKERDLVGPQGVCIDLHWGLLGVSGATQRCWDVLLRRTVRFHLRGGAEVLVLDVPARAMHLALHVAQNGPIDRKALADLERGLDRVDRRDWAEAARLATELEAVEAFAAGLRLLPQGEALARELSLPRRMTVELLLRTRSVPQDAIFFERLAEARGVRAKTALVARKLVPTPGSLRAESPLARCGRVGLVCARLLRPLSLAVRLGPALLAWRRARRAVKGEGFG